MAGTKMGHIKRKLGLKGKTKPGEMIARMNALKTQSAKKLSMAGYNKFMEPVRNELRNAVKPLADRVNNSRLGKAIQPHLPLVKYLPKKTKRGK